MKHNWMVPAVAVLLLATTACAGPKSLSEAEAAGIADQTQTALASRNVPAIESRYAKSVVGIDPGETRMSTSWENWDKLQKVFVANQFDTISVPDRRIQVLDANTFLVTGIGTAKNSLKPTSETPFRFSHVYHREEGGDFAIVNEHASLPPAKK